MWLIKASETVLIKFCASVHREEAESLCKAAELPDPAIVRVPQFHRYLNAAVLTPVKAIYS
jgi:hypothetical protein